MPASLPIVHNLEKEKKHHLPLKRHVNQIQKLFFSTACTKSTLDVWPVPDD
jgi:hypothetical protein